MSPFLLPEGPEIRVSFDGHRSVDLAALLPAVFLYLELPHSVKCSNVKSAADECDHNAGSFARCLAVIREKFTAGAGRPAVIWRRNRFLPGR